MIQYHVFYLSPSFNLQEHKTAGLSFANQDISLESQRDDAELGIGITTRTTVMKLFKKGDVEPRKADKFFYATRTFFSVAYNYCVQWLPIEDEFLKPCIFIDFGKRNNVTFRNIETTITSFTNINQHIIDDPSILDAVEKPFLDFQAMAETDISTNVWEEAVLHETEQGRFYRMDITWGFLKPKVPLLSEVALC